MASRSDIAADFRAMILQIHCPHCGEQFTDGAVDWGNAWLEGRMDTMHTFNIQERDGPYKIKCEWCDQRSWINYFSATASKIQDP
jgi:sarcosine oxidase delta subunit